MDRFDFDDIELSYQLSDGGERVVLVHASPFVSWYSHSSPTYKVSRP